MGRYRPGDHKYLGAHAHGQPLALGLQCWGDHRAGKSGDGYQRARLCVLGQLAEQTELGKKGRQEDNGHRHGGACGVLTQPTPAEQIQQGLLAGVDQPVRHKGPQQVFP